MKLELTPQRIAANKKNCLLGGAAFAAKMSSAYNANPSYCNQCSTILPQSKKNNKFCNSSCSAKYSNARKDYSKFTPGPVPKPKDPTAGSAPYSTLFRCECKHCGVIKLYRSQTKYCPEHRDLYSHAGRAKYWFTFNVFHYPDLFDLNWVNSVGFRSSSNPNGVTRDHKVSVNDAIRNNYDPYYIKHVLNCELMLFAENNKKKTKSSITYAELVIQVNLYDQSLTN